MTLVPIRSSLQALFRLQVGAGGVMGFASGMAVKTVGRGVLLTGGAIFILLQVPFMGSAQRRAC